MPERLPRLYGKVAIITGAGTIGPGIGNGKATAVLFAREGAKSGNLKFAWPLGIDREGRLVLSHCHAF